MSRRHSVLEYQYRDWGNNKAFGLLLLRGTPTKTELARLVLQADSDVFFFAERIGVPTLYHQLWRWSGGPTEDDHSFHEFVAVRAATQEEIDSLPYWGSASDLVTRLCERGFDQTATP